MSGNITSRMRQYGWNTATLASPSCPLSATSTSYPACSSVAAIKRQVVGLSSIIRTLGRLLIFTFHFFRYWSLISFLHAAPPGHVARMRVSLKSVKLVYHVQWRTCILFLYSGTVQTSQANWQFNYTQSNTSPVTHCLTSLVTNNLLPPTLLLNITLLAIRFKQQCGISDRKVPLPDQEILTEVFHTFQILF